jgi:pantetheine-phosphate adenylyltransferase
MRTAIFPGSFDPFTKGHEAIVEQALRLFDRVVIAIGENIGKRSLLSLEARKQLIADLYAGNERVECISYSTLTGDVAREVGASALVRGVRNSIDFEYERTLAQTNIRLFPEIETVLLLTPPTLSDVSSSTVRELLAFGRDVEWLLPEGVNLKEYMPKEQ